MEIRYGAVLPTSADAAFRFVSSPANWPDTENLRVFETVPGGTRLTGTTTAEARRGPRGLIDRITFLAVHGTFRRAMKRLPAQVARP